MIFDKSKLRLTRLGGLTAVVMVAIAFLGVACPELAQPFFGATPVFAVEVISTASAQSEAAKAVLDDLQDGAGKLSAREKLKGVLDVLMAQINDLQKSLSGLKVLNEDQAVQRDEYLGFLDDSANFITALQIDAETSDVRFIAGQLQDWRESVFNQETPKIVDFLLTFQVKSVLKIAETRYLKIFSDVNRLIDLKILKDNKAQAVLSEAGLLLTGATELRNQAEVLLTATGDHNDQIRRLLNDSIAKIKLAYKKFLEISQLVKEALK